MPAARSNSRTLVQIDLRADELFRQQRRAIFVHTDRLFCGLLFFQWLAGIATALWLSPRAWAGSASEPHVHVWAAVFLGAGVISLPVLLASFRPGDWLTRHVIGMAQMLYGALLIHLTGGRIETHFHVFGSLAFLAFYRDWPVLISASAVVAVDHLLRGILWPQSVYGVLVAGEWRWLEHAGWVVFEDVFLVLSCRRGVREMRGTAERQAALEAAHEHIEDKVRQRTAQLESLNRAFEKTAAAARQSEEKYRHTLNAAADAIVCIDEAGNVLEFNRAAQTLLGYSRDEMLGKPLGAIIPERLRDRHLRGVQCFLETGARRLPSWNAIELPGLSKDGREIALEVSLSLLQVDGKKYITGVLRDVTERRQLEMQLAQAQKLESIGQLAAGIAHEINTPIQYVGDNISFLGDAFRDIWGVLAAQRDLARRARDGSFGQAEVAAAEQAAARADLDYLQGEVPKAVEQALEGVGRVAKIVRAMKEFSHPGSDVKAPADLNKLVDNAITVARNEWKYVARVVTDFDPALPPVPCLASEFNQVVLNLIINAAHAVAERTRDEPAHQGVIAIATRVRGGAAEVRVQDNGTGIAPAIRARVFDPFFTTKPVGKGTGQGLAIAHAAIVKKHGGRLTFETEVGGGTTFIIQLPLTAGAANGDPSIRPAPVFSVPVAAPVPVMT